MWTDYQDESNARLVAKYTTINNDFNLLLAKIYNKNAQ